MASLAASAAAADAPAQTPLLALGILTAPSHGTRRAWFRRHTKFPSDVVMWFVIGSSQSMERSGCTSIAPAGGCREPITPEDEREADDFGDILLLDTDDDVRGNPKAYSRQLGTFPSKSLAWFSFAARAYPRAAFIAKADDDSYVGVPGTMHLLAQLQRLPEAPKYVLAGWLQYSSFMRASPGMGTCGWSPVLRDAARGSTDLRSNCYAELIKGNTRIEGARMPGKAGRHIDAATTANASMLADLRGPYPFVAGPFELYSGPLARRIYRSRWTTAFAAALARHFELVEEGSRRGRFAGSQLSNQRLAHGEDALMGHVVHEQARRLTGMTFVALNGPGWARPLVTNLDAVRSLVAAPGEAIDAASVERSRRDVARFVALHKFESNDEALNEKDAKEDRQDVELLKRNITPISNVRAVSLMNRRLKPLIESVDTRAASTVTATRPALEPALIVSDSMLEIRCPPPPRLKGTAASFAAGSPSRRNRTELLFEVGRQWDELSALHMLLPHWRFCIAERAKDPEPSETRRLTPPPPPPPPLPWPLVNPSASRTRSPHRALAWYDLGGLSASYEERPETFTAGFSLSLVECMARCEADQTCNSIVYSKFTGHCTALSNVVRNYTATKCLHALPCKCTCFSTYYLAPAGAPGERPAPSPPVGPRISAALPSASLVSLAAGRSRRTDHRDRTRKSDKS